MDLSGHARPLIAACAYDDTDQIFGWRLHLLPAASNCDFAVCPAPALPINRLQFHLRLFANSVCKIAGQVCPGQDNQGLCVMNHDDSNR